MNSLIEKVDAALEVIKAERRRIILGVQAQCEHKDVFEADYSASNYSTMPPMRVCCECGMSEEGWGPGHKVLTADPLRTISRDTLYSMRRGLMVWDADKTLLIRNETTIQDLLNDQSRVHANL